MKTKTMVLSVVFVLFLAVSVFGETTIESGTLNGGAGEYHWTLSGSPYIIEGSITLPEKEPASFDEDGHLKNFTDYNGNGVWDSALTLTIDAGVIVKFKSGASFNLYGDLQLNSNTSSPVYFTSYKDDIGGDSNQDGDASSPSSGYWRGLRIYDNDSADLHHCVIRYGGYDSSGAVYAYECSPVIRDNIIEHNYYGIEIFGDADTGSSFDPSYPKITNNIIRNNTRAPVFQDGYSFPEYSGNTFTGNGYQAIMVRAYLYAPASQTEVWNDYHETGLPYLVNSNLSLNTNLTLSIPSGTVIKFMSSGRFIVEDDGTLDLQSTASTPIYFTSYRDDSIGGDTNQDGDVTSPSSGNWDGIHINDNDGTDLHHCVIRYGGYDSSGAVSVYECSPVIRDNVIEHSYYGIEIFGDADTSSSFDPSYPKITNNIIRNNTRAPVFQEGYSFPEYSGNTFTGNDYQAIMVRAYLYAPAPQTEVWNDYHETGLPYLVNSNFSLNTNITLSIPSGTIIKFMSSARFIVEDDGTLDLQSTASTPIYFTSYRDDSIGGDTNQDGEVTSPSSGNWDGIHINDNDGADLHHCVIRYGGYDSSGAVSVYECSPVIRDNIIEHSYYGIEIFGDADTGSSFDPSYPKITNNIIRNNTRAPVFQEGYSFPEYSGNTFTGNDYQAIMVKAYLYAPAPQTEVWNDYHETGLPYLVNSNFSLNTNITLSIPSGTIIKFMFSGRFTVEDDGTLDLQGTTSNPVYFTSYRDDGIGGDTNQDGDATSPSSGNWDGIYINDNDRVNIHHCVIRYAGDDIAGIYVYRSSPVIQNNIIEFCHYGLEIAGYSSDLAKPEIKYNTFSNCSVGILNNSYTVPVIHHNNFISSTGYGVRNNSTDNVNVISNYWGDSSGPAHDSNPAGQGDAVYGDVTFSPWSASGYQLETWIRSENIVNVFNKRTGEKIRGARIEINGTGFLTDANGNVALPGVSPGELTLRVSASGYYTQAFSITAETNASIYKQCGLMPEKSDQSGPVVIDVVSKYTNTGKGCTHFLHAVNFNLEFTANIDWNGTRPGVALFKTPKGTFKEADLCREFNMGKDFGINGRLQVIAQSADGILSDPMDAAIKVVSLPPLLPLPFLNQGIKEFSYEAEYTRGLRDIKDGDGPSAVPEDIPLFGGKKFSLSPQITFAASVKSDGNSLYSVVANNELQAGQLFKAAGVEFETSLGGEIGFRYSEDWQFYQGYILAGISASKSFGPYYTLIPGIPVPVYFKAQVGASLDAKLGITGFSDDDWLLSGELSPGLSGRAIAGVGISGALSVEGYLGLGVTYNMDFEGLEMDHSVDLALSGGVTATCLFYQYSQPLLDYKWSWPEEKYSIASVLALSDLRSSDWLPIARDYKAPAFGRSVYGVSAYSSYSLSSNTMLIPGQSGIYPYSNPKMVHAPGSALLVWTTDTKEKSDNNRTSLAYSIYANSAWSSPQLVSEDGTADFYPDVAETESGAICAWQNVRQVMPDDADMAKLLENQEISVVHYDSQTGTWGKAINLTDNSYLDRSPSVAVRQNKAIVTWVSNERNDTLGSLTAPNQIYYALFDGSTWSQKTLAAQGVGSIVKSDLAYNGSQAVLVYGVDEDGDLTTDTDQDLYAIQFDGSRWSAPVRLTDNDEQDANPYAAYDSAGILQLVWYDGQGVRQAGNLDMENSTKIIELQNSSGGADFQLLTDANDNMTLIWPDASERGQDIFLASFDAKLGVWGKGSKATDTDAMERSLSGIWNPDGSLLVAYNKVTVLQETRQIQSGGKIIDIETPIAGPTDLYASLITLEGDLAISEESIALSPSLLVPGSDVAISAKVLNKGLKGAADIQVNVYYGDPSDSVNLIGKITIPGPVEAGGEIQFAIPWTIPEVPESDRIIYVVVDPDLTQDDIDRSNNTGAFTAFIPDYELAELVVNNIGPSLRGILMDVKNKGVVSAADIPIIITPAEDPDTILMNGIIESLAPGETITVSFEWDSTTPEVLKEAFQLSIQVNPDARLPELSADNNKRQILVQGPLMDSDEDGLMDYMEDINQNGVVDENETDPNKKDTDEDGVGDAQDKCNGTLSGALVDPDGCFLVPGDVNRDKNINLEDVRQSLRVITSQGNSADHYSDVDGDNKIGPGDVVFSIQRSAYE